MVKIDYPIGSMYGIFIYTHLHLVDFGLVNLGKYTVRPMDPSWVKFGRHELPPVHQ